MIEFVQKRKPFPRMLTTDCVFSGNRETMSVLVKCRPQNREDTSNLVREIRLFEKEMEMYVKTLPKISNVLGEKKLVASELGGENGFGCKWSF